MPYSKECVWFDGETYERAQDKQRLTGQMLAVWQVMRDGRWYTLDELCAKTGYRSQASVSARVRDLRKHRFGGHDIERRRRGMYEPSDGLYEYRLVRGETK